MGNKTKRWLSVAGIAISVIGFYVEKAGHFPLIQGIIAPSYVAGKAALEKLRRDGALSPNDEGFPAVAALVQDWIAPQNPFVPRNMIVVDRLSTSGGGMAFGQSTSTQIVGLQVYFQGQSEPVQWDLLQLEAELDSRWSTTGLRWAVWLFWLGVLQAVWPLFVPSTGSESGSAEETRTA